MVSGTDLYKRLDIREGTTIPLGAIPCQEADPISKHHPHWVPVNREDPADKWFIEAWEKQKPLPDGTYELLGPKINGNRENLTEHVLEPHGARKITDLVLGDNPFESIRAYMEPLDIEGLIFKNLKTGVLFKIRKKDYLLKRKPN
jgi:hypothetical protein